MSFNLNSLWLDWRAKVPDGTPNPSNAYHLVLLKELCFKQGIDKDIIDNVMLVLEKDEKIDPETIVKYKDEDGEEKETQYSYASKQPEGTPAKTAADRLKGSDDDEEEKDVTKLSGDELSTDTYADKALSSKGDDEDKEDGEEKEKAQSNGYVGEKDKTIEKGDPSSTEEYKKEPEPNDETFEEKNEKHKNPEPPSPIDLSDIVKNPKFPKRYMKMLERMVNTRLNTKTKKWEHFSDIPGGAGQIKAQSGELISMMGTTMGDEEFDELTNRLIEHEEALIEKNPTVFKKKNKDGKWIPNPGSRIVDKTWVQAARDNRKVVLQRLEKQYGKGTKVIGGAWDSKDEVEAMGLSDYENNKGFSTDTYFKVEKPNGEQVIDEVSNKKSTKVNFLNSGAGIFPEWDEDLPDEINQEIYRENQRKRNISFIENNRKEVDDFLQSKEAEPIKKLMKSKGIDLETSLKGNSRDKQNVLFQTIKLMQ